MQEAAEASGRIDLDDAALDATHVKAQRSATGARKSLPAAEKGAITNEWLEYSRIEQSFRVNVGQCSDVTNSKRPRCSFPWRGGVAMHASPHPRRVDLHMPGTRNAAFAAAGQSGQRRGDADDALDLPVALIAGAAGYLPKNIDTDYLTRAIRRAAADATVVAETMTAKLVAPLLGGTPAAASELEKLAPRERQITACPARGESNNAIARPPARSTWPKARSRFMSGMCSKNAS
ncbi:hypothetical protein [Massilia sp. S19_KUP03_FR1]|uniref:hypothetical protein n=1 Tax=Massilia sp. S19_KUP03_FR1 TaxID=3025503 RepID=UPI002FCDBAF2